MIILKKLVQIFTFSLIEVHCYVKNVCGRTSREQLFMENKVKKGNFFAKYLRN
jgi:hypothetical protein